MSGVVQHRLPPLDNRFVLLLAVECFQLFSKYVPAGVAGQGEAVINYWKYLRLVCGQSGTNQQGVCEGMKFLMYY
jgi:hypothetical protein